MKNNRTNKERKNLKRVDLGKVTFRGMVFLNLAAIMAALIQCLGASKVSGRVYEINETAYISGGLFFVIMMLGVAAVVLKSAYGNIIEEAGSAIVYVFFGTLWMIFEMSIFTMFVEINPTYARSITMLGWGALTFVVLLISTFGAFLVACKDEKVGECDFTEDLNDGFGVSSIARAIYKKDLGE